LKEMINLKELVGGVGSNVNASRANDGEEESRVQVLLISQLRKKCDRARVRVRRRKSFWPY
jgi:hypothetical protein